MKKTALVAAVAASLVLSSCGTAAVDGSNIQPGTVTVNQAERNVISVTSTENVKVIPDMAEIVFGVYTEAAEAAACQAKNAEDVNKVIELLKGAGVAETSIQTSNFQLSPRYDYSNNSQKLMGYEARTSITVSDLPLDQVSALLSSSVNAGINTIESLTYSSSQYDESYQEALKLAIASAKSKADIMAAASSCAVGSVASITETSNRSSARYTDNNFTKEMSAANATETSPQIMPGEIDVEAMVTVEYFIQ